MAEFSKQWCDLNDPEMPHDFDIELVASKLKPDYYYSYICEGFGFSAIGKNSQDDIILFFSDFGEDTKYKGWIDYVDFMSEQKPRKL